MSHAKIHSIVVASVRHNRYGFVVNVALVSALVSALIGCKGHEQSAQTGSSGPDIVALPPASSVLLVPLGVPAGVVNDVSAEGVTDPYTGNAAAIKQGGQIMIEMNCADCHGYGLKGGMGPDLTDTYWRYGGSPALIFKSIYEGRPQGMPAWGKKLSPDVIWKMVAYIQSLNGGFPAGLAEEGRQGNLGDSDAVADIREARLFHSGKGLQNER